VGEPRAVSPLSHPPRLDAETREALRLLARGLTGALEVAGLEELPRVTEPTAATTMGVPPDAATRPTSATAAPGASSLGVLASFPATAPQAPAAAAPAMGSEAEALEIVRDTQRQRAVRLKVLADEVIGACTRCKLHRGRNRLFFGAGNPDAAVVFLGEGPGADEDRTGQPFVGEAGQLLTRMIEAMHLSRDDVYICNVVKCRPPNNRDPEPDEVEECERFLKEQLAIVQPKVIVGLGPHACHTLLRTRAPFSRLRGQWHRYEGIDFMPTYHPNYLLRENRDPSKTRKREAWSDLQLVMLRLGLRA